MREEGELVPTMAASICRHCHGWALQVVFALGGQFCGAELPRSTQGCAQAWDSEQGEPWLPISPVLSPAPNWQQIGVAYLTAFISV